MESLLKNYKYWPAFDWTGGTTICVRDTIAPATQYSPACLQSKGRIASVILQGTNANLLLLGTYWPSGSSQEALTSKIGMQEHIKTLINTYSNCTLINIGDINATIGASDRTSNTTYQADIMYRNFLLSNNLSPCKEETTDLGPTTKLLAKTVITTILTPLAVSRISYFL
eukprot:1138169-Pelagomonas_calceolata.AAC.2